MTLLGPLKTESFVNDTAVEAGKFYSDLRPVENGASGTATMAISYNATTQSYTVSTGGSSQTFTQANKVASGSSDFTAFNKASGSVNDSLSLTNPGSSGPLAYTYVGGGAWEHVTIGSTTLDFRYNPFTYGLATPASDLQRSGTGRYAVSLVGALEGPKPYAMAGTGTMQVDFLNGSLSTTGALTSLDVGTGLIQSLGIFYGSASLAGSANAFNGTFAMDDGTRYTGGWEGRFYGPANQEVGAVWHMSSSDGKFAAGYLLGRSDSAVSVYNTSLLTLQFTEDFAVRFTDLTFIDSGSGIAAVNPDLSRSSATLTYDATAASFRFLDTGSSIDSTFTAASLNGAKTNNAVAVYEMTGTGGVGYRLTLSRPGPGNPQVALTYASFGHWEQAQSSLADARDRWFVWGVRTNGFQIPTSGTGRYDGTIVGTGLTAKGGAMYSLGGTGSVDIDFGTAGFTGSLHPIGTSLTDSSTLDFGTFAVGAGSMDVDGGLSGIVVDGASNYLGFFEGALFGPQATELGATFGFQTATLNSSGGYKNGTAVLSGALVATKTSP